MQEYVINIEMLKLTKQGKRYKQELRAEFESEPMNLETCAKLYEELLDKIDTDQKPN